MTTEEGNSEGLADPAGPPFGGGGHDGPSL